MVLNSWFVFFVFSLSPSNEVVIVSAMSLIDVRINSSSFFYFQLALFFFFYKMVPELNIGHSFTISCFKMSQCGSLKDSFLRKLRNIPR